MKPLILLIFILVYAFCSAELGYSASSPWWTHLTYSFQHGSWLHLAINALGFVGLYGTLVQFIKPVRLLLIAYVVAVAASFVCVYRLPVVGASAVVYTMLGMYLSLLLFRRIHYRRRGDLWIFLLSVVSFLIISFVKQNTAGMLHLVCLLSGVSIGALYFKILKR